MEHINRQFKGPIAVRPVFLHSPHRVEALVFLLMIALMIYFLVQRKYRENTPEDAPQKEYRITAATILKAFHNYALVIKRNALVRFICPSQLTTPQRDILRRHIKATRFPSSRTNLQPPSTSSTQLTNQPMLVRKTPTKIPLRLKLRLRKKGLNRQLLRLSIKVPEALVCLTA